MIYQLTTSEPQWLSQARCSKRLARHFTGLEVETRVIKGPDWPREKLQLMAEASEQGPFIFLDTDIAFVESYDMGALLQLCTGALCVAPARYQQRVAKQAADVGWGHDLDKDRFFNSGMVVASERHTPLFRRAIEILDKHGPGFWADEGPLNDAAQEMDAPLYWIDPRLNVQTRRIVEPGAIAIHHMGQGCRAPVLRRWCIRFDIPTARLRGDDL